MATNYTTADIRNIALVGHAGCGKTTLAERILETTKVIGRIGTVEEGNTVCDFEPEEKHHQHSLTSAVVHFDHKGKRINLIDTPGYPDFIGQAISVLPAVETVVVMIDAQKGIENVTRRMMKLAGGEGLSRAIVINKIDHASTGEGGLDTLIETIRETFGHECLPVNLPTDDFKSVVDCFRQEEGDSEVGDVGDAHGSLVDQIVEVDDDLMEAYLETGEVSAEQLVSVFTKAVAEGHLIPIFFTSGKEGAGVSELLDTVADLFQSPADVTVPRFLIKESADAEETEWKPDPDPDKPFVGHTFRITTDPFVGKLAAFRIHQGSIESGASVTINDARKATRLAHLFQLQGKDHVEIHKAIPGDIVAVAKIEEMCYDAALHVDLPIDSIRTKAIPIPKPMFGLAVSPTKRGEEGKIGTTLSRLTDEDPTFVVERDQTTNELVIRGIGELHLRVMIEKMKGRFNVEVDSSPPTIAYKETIMGKAEGHHRHKKQTGGAGQFGEVYLRIEPLPSDFEGPFDFVDDTFGGSIPKQFLPAIEKGIRQVLLTGCIAGYPMQGIRVSVYDGKHHPVDSKEVAFVAAGKKAFMEAVGQAKPILLEPYVSMEITVPNDYMGDVTGDLAGRRGRVQGSDMLPGGQAVITAIAPLSEVMTYASALKAMTQGTGSYAMEHSHDEQTPSNVQAEVVARFKPKDEE